ncbi:MAG: recombination mediator RecR [Phycisphaerales bacterium]|nr:recombination mediator RecR [Phycisphaerales bacterium]
MQAKYGPNAKGSATGGEPSGGGVGKGEGVARQAGKPAAFSAAGGGGGGGSGGGYPAPVARLIDELAALPGIGRRSAERLALHLLKRDKSVAMALAGAIESVKTLVRNCRICSNLSDGDICGVCADVRRDAGIVLVVEQPRDLLALEQTGMYRGVYHVLLGRLSPMDGIGPEALTVDDLLARVRDAGRNARGTPVHEVIMGLNPTLEGDGTALYLAEQLKESGVSVSRLARGLPTGSQLEFASKAVLADAISGRQSVT